MGRAAFSFRLSELLNFSVRARGQNLGAFARDRRAARRPFAKFRWIRSRRRNRRGEIRLARAAGWRCDDGHSAVNQAPITGESMPVEKKPGDPVFAGTINGEGSLEVRVTKAAGDSTLARIIQLVGEAQAQKAPAAALRRRLRAIYTPAVFVAGAARAALPPLFFGGAWEVWAYRALVLLVIACPCALVIATPVSIVSGLTALARRGVLIKGGAYLEAVGKLRALAVDKTGTITEGNPRVQRSYPVRTASPKTKSCASPPRSTRTPTIRWPRPSPLTRRRTDRRFRPSRDYQSRTRPRRGGALDGHPHFIGNHHMAHELASARRSRSRARRHRGAGQSARRARPRAA